MDVESHLRTLLAFGSLNFVKYFTISSVFHLPHQSTTSTLFVTVV